MSLAPHGLSAPRLLRGTPLAGLYEARSPLGRWLVTISAPQYESDDVLRVRYARAPSGMLALRNVGALDADRAFLVEAAPEGVPATERAPLSAYSLGAVLGPLGHDLMEMHENGALAAGLRPDMIFAVEDEEGARLAGFTPRQGPFLAGARPVGAAVPALFDEVYLAPEQLEGLAPSAATDIHAFAACLHRLGTGAHPFAGHGDAAAAAIVRGERAAIRLDGALGELVDRALDVVPGRRPPLRELVDALGG